MFGPTLSNPLDMEVKMLIRTKKGMARQVIFNGTESPGLWNIFTDRKSEEKKRVTERIALNESATQKKDTITPLTLDTSPLPL